MAPKSKKQNFVKSIESDFLILTMKLWGPVLAGLLSSGMKGFEIENMNEENRPLFIIKQAHCAALRIENTPFGCLQEKHSENYHSTSFILRFRIEIHVKTRKKSM